MMLADAVLTNYPPMRIGCPIEVPSPGTTDMASKFFVPTLVADEGWQLRRISRADALHCLNVNAQLARAALQFQPLKRVSIERPDGTKQHMFVPEFL